MVLLIRLNVVVIGHVDAGKSTLLGQLLVQVISYIEIIYLDFFFPALISPSSVVQ